MRNIFATDSKKRMEKGKSKVKRWKKEIEKKAKRDDVRDKSNRNKSAYQKSTHYLDGFEFILNPSFSEVDIEKEAKNQSIVPIYVSIVELYNYEPHKDWNRESSIFYRESEVEYRFKHSKTIEKQEIFPKYEAGKIKNDYTTIELITTINIQMDEDSDAFLLADMHLLFKNAGKTEEADAIYELKSIKEQFRSRLINNFKKN